MLVPHKYGYDSDGYEVDECCDGRRYLYAHVWIVL